MADFSYMGPGIYGYPASKRYEVNDECNSKFLYFCKKNKLN